MSTKLREDLRRRFPPTDDPEILARRLEIVCVLLEGCPQVKQQLIEEGIQRGIKQSIEKGELLGFRRGLVLVLARRQLGVTAAQGAQIEQCVDADVLRRWIDQAMTAATADEALR